MIMTSRAALPFLIRFLSSSSFPSSLQSYPIFSTNTSLSLPGPTRQQTRPPLLGRIPPLSPWSIRSRLPSSIKARHRRTLQVLLHIPCPFHPHGGPRTNPQIQLQQHQTPSTSLPTLHGSTRPKLFPSIHRAISSCLHSTPYHHPLAIRPSITVTKAYLKMSELGDAARKGELKVDGSIVL
ncbi:hypothetical protein BDQ12DRAFT_371108 [Crucibulum laeve]|uniref:GTP cyclohydrolase N-terminal domain-containing protein n=1 Tax=Crucibulum laeve TaxID=68775 RepID=A0A5C3LQ16_9AGAR|nr:hypothetical protein BDQ12DRAFT_371108 [Crucibulum laeve]